MKVARDPKQDASQAKRRKTDHDEAEVGPSAMEVAFRPPQSLVRRFRIYGLVVLHFAYRFYF